MQLEGREIASFDGHFPGPPTALNEARFWMGFWPILDDSGFTRIPSIYKPAWTFSAQCWNAHTIANGPQGQRSISRIPTWLEPQGMLWNNINTKCKLWMQVWQHTLLYKTKSRKKLMVITLMQIGTTHQSSLLARAEQDSRQWPEGSRLNGLMGSL